MVKFVELLSNENIPEELYDDSSYENETDVDNDLSFMNDVVFENKCISMKLQNIYKRLIYLTFYYLLNFRCSLCSTYSSVGGQCST